MFYDPESDKLTEQDDLSRLIIGGYSDFADAASSGSSTMYYNNSEVVINFYDGYIRTFENNYEVTGNFKRMWFVEHIDNPPTTNVLRIPISSTTVSSTLYTATGPQTFYPESTMYSAASYHAGTFKSIENMIKHLAKMNGIYVSKEIEEKIPFSELLMLYAFPLLRENYVEGMSTVNLKSLCENNMGNPLAQLGFNGSYESSVDTYDNYLKFMYYENVKDAVTYCLNGNYSKKIMSIISKRFPLILKKTQQIIEVEEDVLLNRHIKVIQNNDLKVQGFGLPVDGRASKIELNTDILSFIQFLSLFLSIDHIQTVLTNCPQQIPTFLSGVFHANHELLKQYSQARLVKLFSEEFEIDILMDAMKQFCKYRCVEDIPRQLKETYPNGIPLPKKPKNWKEVHDRISKIYNEIKAAEKDIPFEYTPEEFGLHYAEKDNVMVTLPSSGKTVVGWGKKFGHCIASYVERHDKRECVLLGVHVDGVLTYNAEFKSTKNLAKLINDGNVVPNNDPNELWELKQCRGKSNKDAPDYVQELVKEIALPILGFKEPLVTNG